MTSTPIACACVAVAAFVAAVSGIAAAQGGANPAAAGAAAAAQPAAAPMPLPHGIVPNRAELPMSAFNKLDTDSKGYVTLDDVRQLDGFASAFAQADQNRDGRLNASEFNSAWAIYTGNTP